MKYTNVRVLMLGSGYLRGCYLGYFDVIIQEGTIMNLINTLGKKYHVLSIETDASGIIFIECMKR